MVSLKEKVNCVVWHAKLKSAADFQRRFRTHYNKKTHRNHIPKFQETGFVIDKPRSCRPKTKEFMASLEQHNKFKGNIFFLSFLQINSIISSNVIIVVTRI